MTEGYAVLIFYSFLVAGSCLSYKILDEQSQEPNDNTYHGRYTRDVKNPELLIPRRVREDGSFLTFALPKFYDRQELEARKKRSAAAAAAVNADANANANAETDADAEDLADDRLHLVLPFNGADHHVELTPHHEFISPDMVVETRGEGAFTDLNTGLRFKRVSDLQCHYRGHVRDHENSKAVLSLCDGVAGYVQTDQGRFFIEPLSESVPGEEGQHVHMIYDRKAPHEELNENKRNKRSCGTSDNWESAWAEQLEKKNRRERLAGNTTSLKRASAAGSHSIHRYLEIGVFCDKKFLEYHKDIDYEQYVLTTMNMVADYYHDASTGNQIDVVVVRIVYLEKEKEEIDLSISPNADKTLESFAAWADKMNPKDTKHPNHHDVAVLITRYDICSQDEDGCNLLGLAYVSAACDPTKAACINEDSGMMLGITVTHEVGHTLGCSHDTVPISGCEPQDEKDKSFYIMSPYLDPFTLRWSPCGRKFITTFLDTLGDCLSDNAKKKPNDKYKLPGMLAGAMYDAQFQCNLMFPGSTPCVMAKNICEGLYCKLEPTATQCTSKEAPAPGTKCGENKWCIQKKCVEIGKRPASVHGGWGTWGKLTECSRTCGGGIRYRERECDNPKPRDGGRYCLGERKKFTTCNTSPCDEKKPSFRAVQCTEYNSKNIMSDGLHTWTPFLDKTDAPCVLYCINEKRTYTRVAPTCKDGTPCKAGTKDMCINGVCRKIGCDWGIDSDAEDDQCGICKGDGTQCTPVEGDYKVTGKSDYQKIVTIPKGSLNIKVEEKGPSQNTLAIKLDKGNKYILNGDHHEEINGEYPCAGSIAIYEHVEPQKEEILIRGPTQEAIELQYTFYDPKNNPGVHYIYYTKTGRSSKSAAQYQWDFLEWGSCSAKCGGGTQVAQAACIEQQSGKVSNSFCKNIQRPDPKSRVCNNKPCGAKWRVSQWSRCSACGGKKGQERRKVQCVKPSAKADGEDVQAELSACKGKAPKQSRPCTGSRPCRKTCAKKTRSNVFDERKLDGDAEREERPSLEERRNIIDKLVDTDMSRYYLHEKPNSGYMDNRSEKRNAESDFDHLTDDWAAPFNDPSLDGTANCLGGASQEHTTQKPGSIVKDNILPDNIVLQQVPFLDEAMKSNLSDQAFQEEGDSVGMELDTSRMKVFKGAEAAKLLETNHGNHTSSNNTGSNG